VFPSPTVFYYEKEEMELKSIFYFLKWQFDYTFLLAILILLFIPNYHDYIIIIKSFEKFNKHQYKIFIEEDTFMEMEMMKPTQHCNLQVFESKTPIKHIEATLYTIEDICHRFVSI